MEYIIADSHCDTILDIAKGIRSLSKEADFGHVDFPRLVKGKIKLQFMALFAEENYRPHGTLIRSLELLDLLKKEIKNSSEYISLVLFKKDLEFKPNATKLLVSIEGGEALCGSLEILRCFYDLGVRSLGLTWNNRNEIADGCSEEPFGKGLSKFGKEVVGEMNKLGMLIDTSHLSEQSFWDVLKFSTQPVIASHSCCKSLCDHPRNLSDQQMKALSKKNGVMGINFYPPFLSPTEEANIEDVVRHIIHASTIMGTRYVGLGSDFDGINKVPCGLEDVTKLQSLIPILESKGFSSQDIANIMGNNIIQILKKVLPNETIC